MIGCYKYPSGIKAEVKPTFTPITAPSLRLYQWHLDERLQLRRKKPQWSFLEVLSRQHFRLRVGFFCSFLI
jgi:hypothetical protein